MYESYFQMSLEIKRRGGGKCCTSYIPNKERRIRQRWKQIYVETDCA